MADALHGWEYQSAVAGHPARRLDAAIALLALHAIFGTEEPVADGSDFSVCEVVELLLAYIEDSAVRAHPRNYHPRDPGSG